jgi:hypothetical protein
MALTIFLTGLFAMASAIPRESASQRSSTILSSRSTSTLPETAGPHEPGERVLGRRRVPCPATTVTVP